MIKFALYCIIIVRCFECNQGKTEFPFLQFLETAFSPKTIQERRNLDNSFVEHLKQVYLCRESTGGACCDCNKLCMNKRSCCIDYLWDPYKPLLLNEYLAKFQNEMERHPKSDCISVEPFSSLPNFRKSFMYMIYTCTNLNNDNMKFCISDTLLKGYEKLPVVDADGNIYRNKYCALCNNVNTYAPINVTLKCFRPETMPPSTHFSTPSLPTTIYYTTQSSTSKSSPSTTSPPPLTLPLIFYTSKHKATAVMLSNGAKKKTPLSLSIMNKPGIDFNLFTKCAAFIHTSGIRSKKDHSCIPKNFKQNLCNKTEFSSCHYYQARDELGHYRNFHCSVCENNRTTLTAFDGCTDNYIELKFTWSVTIDFTTKNTQVSATEKYQKSYHYKGCSSGKVLNVITNTCEDFSCAPGFEVFGTKCERIRVVENKTKGIAERNSNFFSYLSARNASLYIIMKPNITIALSNLTRMFESNFNTPYKKFVMISKETPTVLKRILSNVTVITIKDVLQNISDISIFDYVEEMDIFSSDIYEITQIYGFDLSRHFSDGRICSETPVKVANLSFSLNVTTLKNTNFILTVSNNTIKQNVFQCSCFHLMRNCSLIHLESRHYKLSNVTTMEITVSTKQGNIKIKPLDYLPTSKGIAVCQNLFREVVSVDPASTIRSDWHEEFHDIQAYIAFALNIISVISGILFIVAHVLLKELRNRGGCIILALEISVLISDLLYIMANFSVNSESVCKSVGILLHVFLLVVNIWASILIFDLIYEIMLKKVGNQNSKGNNRLFKYVLVSHVPPILIVTICVVLDETNTVVFGYGKNGVCWIESYYPSLVTFLIPVAFGYNLYFVGCIVLLRHLRQEITDRRTSLRGSMRADINLLGITTKIIVVLGLVEILGFVQIRKDTLNQNDKIVNTIFAFIYNIMRVMRGTLIFIFYLMNNKTLMMYRRWRQQRNKNNGSRSNITLSTFSFSGDG